MVFLFLILMLFALIIDICCCISSAKMSQEEFEKTNEFVQEKAV